MRFLRCSDSTIKDTLRGCGKVPWGLVMKMGWSGWWRWTGRGIRGRGSGRRSGRGFGRRRYWGGCMLESGRTREELIGWLVELARETPRMVVGVDCCFSFPAWFLRGAWVRDGVRVLGEGGGGARVRSGCIGSARMGGSGGLRGVARNGKRPEEFCGERAAADDAADGLSRTRLRCARRVAMRSARRRCRGLRRRVRFRLAGVGAWGRGSLRAMPWLMRLREAGFRVWPFESALLGKEGRGLCWWRCIRGC